MAEDPFKLTPEQQSRVTRWLIEKKAYACPFCKSTSWAAYGPFGQPLMRREEHGFVMTMGEQSLPLLVLACNNCAFVAQFAWLRVMEGK